MTRYAAELAWCFAVVAILALLMSETPTGAPVVWP